MKETLRFLTRVSDSIKIYDTCAKVLWVFLFISLLSNPVQSQKFEIKLLSPRPDMLATMHDSLCVVTFQIHPPGNYGFEVLNNRPKGVTLKPSEIRSQKNMYLCDVPLGLGRNAVKVFAWPTGQPNNLKMESMDIYYELPKEVSPKIIIQTDTLEVFQQDTFERVRTDTLEVIKPDTVKFIITDTFHMSSVLTENPKIILHRPHPLDDPMRGHQFIAHERQIDVRFSITPYDSLDVFENWIFDPSDPKSAKQTRQRDDTFFEKIDLNKKENKILISVNNQTKGIQLEKTIEVHYEPRNFTRKGKDYALFIAVEDYQEGWVKLQNPVNDIQAIGKVLEEKYGFETDYLYNPSGEEIEAMIRFYVQKKYQPHDQLLIFLSGHGVYDKLFENGYFAPSDADPAEKTRRTYYSYKELKDQITKMGCNKILLMIDACYSGAFFDRPLVYKSGDRPSERPKIERIFHEMEKKTYKALTSADRQTTTYDTWYGLSLSPFTDQIIKTLNTLDPDGIVALNDLERGMEGLGSIGQSPVLHSFAPLLESPGADFYFIQK